MTRKKPAAAAPMLLATRPRLTTFQDASPFPLPAWQVDVPLGYLETQLTSFVENEGLDLDPDFQRAHVWTEAQQIAYVEYRLLGGPASATLFFYCSGYLSANPGPVTIVDGKQRLEALRRFMRDDLPVFGYRLSEFADKPRMTRGGSIRFCVADLDRRAALTWYLAINAAGTPHTADELERVRALLTDPELEEDT